MSSQWLNKLLVFEKSKDLVFPKDMSAAYGSMEANVTDWQNPLDLVSWLHLIQNQVVKFPAMRGSRPEKY